MHSKQLCRSELLLRTCYLLGDFPVYGCATPTGYEGAVVTRHGFEQLEVRCQVTEQAWYLTCNGSHWLGEVGNCDPTQSGKDLMFV